MKLSATRGLLPFLLTTFFTIAASSQDYYSGKTEIACYGEVYKILSASDFLYLSNKKNHLIDELRYKVGSNPVRYYSYATGMGTPAGIDYDKYDEIVRKVFTDEEIEKYSRYGFIIIRYCVDTQTGRTLEVEFVSWYKKGVTGNPYNAIPIEKFYELEKLLKAEMVCSLSDELRKEKQSHGYATTHLF
ncbi:MAG: DUF5043 domain-containing protein [Bacteroidales bacterium]|jgi:hypothetical protein|nr:DUF5043 domain-containing protein [Bacteroidales bacterium]MCI2136369.1 DUF5043 domain-containing protein [Bacteroidales bacterium]